LLWRAAGSRLATAQTAGEMSWRHGGASWEELQEPWQWHATSWEQGLAASSGSRGSWPSQGGWSRGGRHGASHGGGRATSRPPPVTVYRSSRTARPVHLVGLAGDHRPQLPPAGPEVALGVAQQSGCASGLRHKDQRPPKPKPGPRNALLLLTHLLAAECVCVSVSVLRVVIAGCRVS